MPTDLPLRRSPPSFAHDMSAVLLIVAAMLLLTVIVTLAFGPRGLPDPGEDFALPCVRMGEF